MESVLEFVDHSTPESLGELDNKKKEFLMFMLDGLNDKEKAAFYIKKGIKQYGNKDKIIENLPSDIDPGVKTEIQSQLSTNTSNNEVKKKLLANPAGGNRKRVSLKNKHRGLKRSRVRR